MSSARRVQRLAHRVANCAAVRSASCCGVSPSLLGRPLHLLAVLVHAGDEQHVIAVEPLEARDRVGRDALIGMADMRRAIGVGNGRGDHVSGTLDMIRV